MALCKQKVVKSHFDYCCYYLISLAVGLFGVAPFLGRILDVSPYPSVYIIHGSYAKLKMLKTETPHSNRSILCGRWNWYPPLVCTIQYSRP